MAQEIKARIQLKHETEQVWKNTTNFIPMIGEMIIYDVDDNYNYERFKIGDGVRNVNELPFNDDKKPGKIVTGEEFIYGGQTYTAGEGAEIFNDLSTNKAVGDFSHAEGYNTMAMGHMSHAENDNTFAEGFSSHAEGYATAAFGDYSHAEGELTQANGEAQHVQGKYNIPDTESRYAHIIGNGGNGDGHIYYSNAHTVDWDGNAWFAGNIKIGGIDQDDESAKSLATTDYVDNKIAAIPTPDVSSQIDAHNVSTSAHNDIRNLISGLTTSGIKHNNGNLLSSIIDNYIINIDYENLLAFDTSEIVIGNSMSTSSVLGQAILGQMILA